MSRPKKTFLREGSPTNAGAIVTASIKREEFERVISCISRSRESLDLPALTDDDKKTILDELLDTAMDLDGARKSFALDASRADVRSTLIALSQISNADDFLSLLKKSDSTTQAVFFQAQSTENLAIEQLRSIAISAERRLKDQPVISVDGKQYGGKNKPGRRVDEHYWQAIGRLARIWEKYSGRRAGHGKSEEGPFVRFLRACSEGCEMHLPTNWDLIEKSLKRARSIA